MFEQFASQISRASYVFVLFSECTGKMSSNNIHNQMVMKVYMSGRHEKTRNIGGLIVMITIEATPS